MGIEHLMSAAKSGGLKKKRPLTAANNSAPAATRAPAPPPAAPPAAAPAEISKVISGDVDLAAIQQNFGAILNALKQPAPQIANRLVNAEPTALDGDTLTLAYPDEFNRGMCEKSADQITEAVSKAIGQKVKLKFVLSESKKDTDAAAVPGAKISQEKKDEITSDPAVQMVLNRLNANVTDIEKIS
jgi:hypothetical protein